MNTVKENLIAAKKVYEANHPRWSFHQAIDYSVEEDADYSQVMEVLKASMPQVPKPADTNLVRWSHRAGFDAVVALFDRAIAACPDP